MGTAPSLVPRRNFMDVPQTASLQESSVRRSRFDPRDRAIAAPVPPRALAAVPPKVVTYVAWVNTGCCQSEQRQTSDTAPVLITPQSTAILGSNGCEIGMRKFRRSGRGWGNRRVGENRLARGCVTCPGVRVGNRHRHRHQPGDTRGERRVLRPTILQVPAQGPHHQPCSRQVRRVGTA